MDSPNDIFNLAVDIVQNTSQSVFLTGKAGTGKTTFLHHIKNNVDKNIIVAAPTGVAAINAGGVTLHSLLQLPFEPYIPNYEGKKKLEYHFKLRKSKIEMLRELELLIIDEVSMLRADTLDAIDYMLRRYRDPYQAFGGVQVLFIGDMFQLPPVVQQNEWEELRQYYPSPFFYHAQVLENNMPLYIELKTIYRQSDQKFIDILNNIRNNCVTTQDLATLNRRYNPSFKPSEASEKYIVLCTHNYKADRINNEELSQLVGSPITFRGKISGDFSENALPTESDLTLKLGAQVMFIRNDAGDKRRYYNGKLATVSYISEENIFVRFEDGSEMELERETWRNVRYSLNTDSGDIEEEELGSFTQYPIRLAWAITIHKSQGLTFERVVIDAGQAFAAGQVYVALSRCTSLEGIVLYSRITPNSIRTDEGAIAFARQEKSIEYLKAVLTDEKPRYCANRLKDSFDWATVIHATRSFYELVSEKKIPNQEKVLGMASGFCNKAIEQEDIARNFRKELESILSTRPLNIQLLQQRVCKAAMYFHRDLQQHILVPFKTHLNELKNASKVKLYLRNATEIANTLENFLAKLESIHYGDILLTGNIVFDQLKIPKKEIVEKKTTGKAQKGDSVRLTLELFNNGKSIKEIATERNLSTTTIEGHLASLVLEGELDANQIIEDDKLTRLVNLINNLKDRSSLGMIKSQLPDEFSYFDIKVILNHLRKG